MDGIFVVGTDTDAGKTVVAAGLLKMVHSHQSACYFKPVQTGTIVGDDTQTVKELTELGADYFLEPAYRFPEPISPHLAAKKWNRSIELSVIEDTYRAHKKDKFMIVEGAGGLLVPYSDEVLQINLVKKLGLPVILVTEDRLGAINLTLLSLYQCKHEHIPILGVVMVKTKGDYLGNAEAISHFGNVKVLGEFPLSDPKTMVAQVSCDPTLRGLLHLPTIPS